MKRDGASGSLPHSQDLVPDEYLDDPFWRSLLPASSVDPSWREHSSAIEEIDRCFHMRTSWDGKLMAAICEADRLGTYEQEGYQSVADWLSAHLGLGYKRTQELVEVALCLQELPHIARAYEQGLLSFDHLRALVQVADAGNERDLLLATKGMSVSDTFRVVAKIIKVSQEDAVLTRRERHLEMTWDHNRRVLILYAELPEEQGAMVERAIEVFARRMPEDPLFEPDRTPMGAKRADALVELATCMTSGGGGSEGVKESDDESGSGIDAIASPKALVVLHVEAEPGGEVGIAEIEGGPVVGQQTAERLMCDPLVSTVVHDLDGQELSTTKAKKAIPTRTRREVARRDRTCRFGSCRKRGFVDIHHIQPRGQGGGHEEDNLILLCPTHHHLVHESGWKVVGKPPDTQIVRPDLPVIRNGPPPRPADVEASFRYEFALARGPDGLA
jgi:hypothetical protein